ncbi:hypothetical protein FJY93_00980 [Candidatus Kaiserbacteria bacterium]|nr:hypothetical protein [Candidatus Kaiserbacteria bacterium]
MQIGDVEIPLEDFVAMAVHFLSGGFFDWNNGETPSSVNEALTTLFARYYWIDGRWVLKKDATVS